MGNEKLKDLTPTTVTYEQGDRPTHIKLTGAMQQIEKGLEFVEFTIGDAYGKSGNKPINWINNLSRDIGDRDRLSPLHEPDVNIAGYVQNLTLGKNEHEADLIPVGTGAAIISSSTDTSIIPAQYKASVSLLDTIGDWTIPPGLNENGVQKNSRRLVAFTPSDGGTVTFAEVTTGHGDVYNGGRWNVMPTVAQADNGGPFCAVTVVDLINNIYEITLPVNNFSYNRLGEIGTATLSNTVLYGTGRQMTFPEYFFDPAELDLLTDDPSSSLGKIYPLGLVRVYDWDTGEVKDGLIEVKAADLDAERPYRIICTFESGVVLDVVTGKYLIVCSSTTVSELLDKVRNEFYNHNHTGDDLVRQIKHSDLMYLRTSHINSSLISEWYGASNIDSNDHSHYLHRNGLDLGDDGSGYNIMRGDLLIGSQVPGTGNDVPNYNLTGDSYSLLFGTWLGPKLYFDQDPSMDLLRLENKSTLALEVLALQEVATPTVKVGHGQLWSDPTDNDLYYKDSANNDFILNRGLVPVGGIIPIMDNYGAAYTLPATGVVTREGWMLCDGAVIPGGMTLTGVTPVLDDDRFVLGVISGGSNVGVTNTHTHTLDSHYHGWSLAADSGGHSHGTIAAGAHYHGISSNNEGACIDATTTCTGVLNTAGVINHGHGVTGGDHGHSISGTVGDTGGTDGNIDNISDTGIYAGLTPQYLTAVYLIRVK